MTQTAAHRSRTRARLQAKSRRRTPDTAARTAAKPKALKSARLEARISPELRATIQRAADLGGRKFTEFVTTALQDAAHRAIADAHVLRLSLADQELFARALITPPAPAPALERAFVRRRDLAAKA